MKGTSVAGTSARSILIIWSAFAAELASPVRGQESAPAMELAAPIRVEAAGKPIDIEAGGAAPCYADFDGDGLADLLVGQSAGGKLRIYRNARSNERPKFGEFEWFKAGAAGNAGSVIPGPDRGMIAGAAGFVPQLVDFDGDGFDDVLSCTGNGGIILFRRQKDGTFSEGENLKRADSQEIVGSPGASVHAADWDGDGDLDLAVSIVRQGACLLRNTGSRRRPQYGDPEPFKAEDDLTYSRWGNDAPFTADWDGDGLADFLLGGGDGSVTFYRRKPAPDDTSLEKGRTLVPPYFHDEQDTAPKPGRNARLCVCDFNGDGRLDLLVGDVWVSVFTPEIELTDEERTNDAAIEKKLESLSEKFLSLRKAPEADTIEARDKRLDDLRVISSRMRALRQELSRPQPKPVFTPHGQVWIYLRRDAK